jgi:hypothetical protein
LDIDARLTTAEISQLWGTYMGDSAQICVLNYFLNIIEDTEIKNIIQDALNASKRQVQAITDMFNRDEVPIPYGFNSNEDVENHAPRIYSDHFILEYLHQFARIGLRAHGVNLSLAVRLDCTEFFEECYFDAVRLYKMCKKLLFSKDLYMRSPFLKTKGTEVKFVKEQHFLTGFFGDKRSLTAPEITHLYANFQRNALGAAQLIGFSQAATSKEVSKYFIRGKEIGEKHCEIFRSYLKEDDLPASLYWDSQVIENSQPVFSDKLMMFLCSGLTTLGVGFYGLSLGSSLRRDLGTVYNRLLVEIQLFAEDGANLMIKNAWLESPPIVHDN